MKLRKCMGAEYKFNLVSLISVPAAILMWYYNLVDIYTIILIFLVGFRINLTVRT